MVNYGSVGASNGHTPEQRIGYGVQTLGVDRITDEVKRSSLMINYLSSLTITT